VIVNSDLIAPVLVMVHVSISIEWQVQRIMPFDLLGFREIVFYVVIHTPVWMGFGPFEINIMPLRLIFN
jgi:hypothetical protein